MERVQRLILKTRTLFYNQAEDSLEPIKTGRPSFDSSASTVSLDTQSQHSRTLTPTSDDCEPSSKTDGASFLSIDCEILREKILSPSSWSSDYETYRSVPKPQFPIRVSDGEPPAFPFELSRRWVEWKPDFYGPGEPYWKAEPDIDLVKPTVRPTLELLGMDGNRIEVVRLGEGAFNKIFTIITYDKKSDSPKDFVFRIALPAIPYYKTECDVATTEFVRNFTTIPVPKIYAYDSSANNDLGLEWMLMEKAPGVQLAHKWVDMDNYNHIALAKQIATWQDELVRIEANKIGGLYLRWTTTNLEFFIGPSNHTIFYLDRRLLYHVNRGPFESIHDFADAVLCVQQHEFDDIWCRLPFRPNNEEWTSDDHYEAIRRRYPSLLDLDAKEYSEKILMGLADDKIDHPQNCLKALRKAITNLCGTSTFRESEDPTSLAHHDISDRNILVDDHGVVTVLLDWENIEFLPIEFIGMYPKFLDSSNDQTDDSNLYRKTFKDKSDYWTSLHWSVSGVIETHLRTIFKERLEELNSVLALSGEGDSTTGDFLNRALDVTGAGWDAIKWLETQEDSETNPEELPQRLDK